MTTISSVALALAAALATTGQQPSERRERATASLQGFNIVLVAGRIQASGNSPGGDVPPAAKKALNDMKDFLPYKHYHLVDSQWTMCCSADELPITGRLQGVVPPDGERKVDMLLDLTFQLAVRRDPDPRKLPIYFTLHHAPLRTAQGTMSVAREAELEKRLSELRRELDTLEDDIRRRRGAENRSEVGALTDQRRKVEERFNQTRSELARGQAARTSSSTGAALIDSNFTMEPGETVVVGTSALGGDTALIAILTAVKRGTR